MLSLPRSLRGEYIVEVNNKPDTTLDVNNVFVFFKGTKNDPEITRVIRAERYTEMDMEEIRDVVYGRERKDESPVSIFTVLEAVGTIREYNKENLSDYNRYLQTARKRNSGQGLPQSGGTNGAGTKRSGTYKSTSSPYLTISGTKGRIKN